jgi:hypothetical protein
MADGGEHQAYQLALKRSYEKGRLEGLRTAERIVRGEAQRRDNTGQSLRYFLIAAIRSAADLIAAEVERSTKQT